MNTDSPGQIAASLGDIEDEMHIDEPRFSELTGIVKRKEKFLETLTRVLYEQVTAYDNPTDRMEQAKAMLHVHPEYEAYLDELEEYQTLRRRFESRDVRRSIGQSLLKQAEQTAHPKHGQQARGQAGVGEQ